MRMYGFLKEPLQVNKKSFVYKVMVHEMKKETMVYEYTNLDAVQCSFDAWYPDFESAMED